MVFENLHVKAEDLPQLESADFEGLEQDYLYMRLTSSGLFFLLLGGLGTIFTIASGWSLWYWLLPLLVFWSLYYVIQIIGFSIKGYAIRQKDISYKSGLLFFSMTSVPFNRIQHCELSQGPLGRLFDLASVKVFTAGGSTSDMTIHGLETERAQRLRDHITKISAEYE